MKWTKRRCGRPSSVRTLLSRRLFISVITGRWRTIPSGRAKLLFVMLNTLRVRIIVFTTQILRVSLPTPLRTRSIVHRMARGRFLVALLASPLKLLLNGPLLTLRWHSILTPLLFIRWRQMVIVIVCRRWRKIALMVTRVRRRIRVPPVCRTLLARMRLRPRKIRRVRKV